MGMDFVIPVAVERVPPQTHASKFVVVYLGSGWINSRIEFRMNLQSLRGGRGGDEIDNHLEAQQRLATPVLADEAKQPVLDLVPLAGARRKVADRDPQPSFIGQLLQFTFQSRRRGPLLPPASAVISKR